MSTTSYEIQSGDTLGVIAQENNTSVAELMQFNSQIKNKNHIMVGQHINIPVKEKEQKPDIAEVKKKISEIKNQCKDTPAEEAYSKQCRIIRVEKVTGPKEITIGESATYEITKYNRGDLTNAEKKKVKWKVEVYGNSKSETPTINIDDCSKVSKYFEVQEDKLTIKKIPDTWSCFIAIYPYIERPSIRVRQISKIDKVELFLVFYIAEHFLTIRDRLFYEAAETRINNIKNSEWYNQEYHKVHMVPIGPMDEIIKKVSLYITKYGGKEKAFVREFSIFSHSGTGDGPVSAEGGIQVNPIEKSTQMAIEGWGKIDFNWSNNNPIVAVLGCNSGRVISDKGKDVTSFCRKISKLDNFKDIPIWGQSKATSPSMYTNHRVTSMGRNLGVGWDIGKHTYLVGILDTGQGWESTSFDTSSPILNEEELQIYPKVSEMNIFQNGDFVRKAKQGEFNDHKK